MENLYSLLSKETIKKFRKEKISETCINRVFNEAISKEAQSNDFIHVHEDGRMTHTKYEFCFSCPIDKGTDSEIDLLFTSAWHEIAKQRNAQNKENKINEEFGNMVAKETLIEELKSLNLLGYPEKKKWNSLRLWLSFSAKKPRHGISGYCFDIDNKDFFTLDEREKIIEGMKNLAKRRIRHLKDEMKTLSAYYNLSKK